MKDSASTASSMPSAFARLNARLNWPTLSDSPWRARSTRMRLKKFGRGFATCSGTRKQIDLQACLLDGNLSAAPSLHVNSLALAYGLADQHQEEGVLAYLKREMKKNIQMPEGRLELYFLPFLMEGLYRVGEAGLAENIIREHYGLMMEHGAWTFWETLKGGLNGLGSLCHGWSCGPLITFSERILGVREYVPGDPSQILVSPESDSLGWARGTVPHPRGLVHVSWRVDGTKLLLALELPKGVTPHIQIVGRLAQLELVRVSTAEMRPISEACLEMSSIHSR